jgi:membrane associated rhomboid family serine protease
MALEQRDYMRDDYQYAGGARRSYGGAPPIASITIWLIVINVAVFLLNVAIARPIYGVEPFTGRRVLIEVVHPIEEWGYFSAGTAIQHLQVWRFVTFQFLHANFGHILFNMIALYFFGPMIEQYLGRRRFLAFYLLCGAAGAVSYVLLWMLGVLGSTPNVPLVGASAGIFGILLAAARVAPDSIVLIYGIIPARLKTVAWVFVAIAVYTVFTNGHNAGGEAGHLGGAILGYFLIAHPHALDFFEVGRVRQPRMRYHGW